MGPPLPMNSHWHAGSVTAADSQDTCQYRNPQPIHWAPLQVAPIGFKLTTVAHLPDCVTTHDGVLDQQIGLQVLPLHHVCMLNRLQQQMLGAVAILSRHIKCKWQQKAARTLYK